MQRIRLRGTSFHFSAHFSFVNALFRWQVINERKSTTERINEVRNKFLQKIRETARLQARDELLLAECRQLMRDNRVLAEEAQRRARELAAVQDLKSKYQEICRLFQKQNKDLVDESARLAECERLKMEDISVRFLHTVEDITRKLEEQGAAFDQQRADNDELEAKLLQFESNEKLSTEHFAAQLKAKNLELQLVTARNDKKRAVLSQERSKGDAYRAHASQLMATEAEMKSQLSLYAEKFDHFQDALNRSNAMFNQFKARMDEMEATIRSQQSLNDSLKKTCSEYDVSLLEQMNLRHGAVKTLDQLVHAKAAHEKTCRRLQVERQALNNRLKSSQQAQPAAAVERAAGTQGVAESRDGGSSTAVQST
jgi:chromosome segregation ATPase